MPQDVSPYWREQMGAAHLISRVELLDPDGIVIRSTDIDSEFPLQVIDCRVSGDRSRTVWGEAECTIAMSSSDPPEILDLLPTAADAPLAPTSGGTFRVQAGYRYTDIGVDEMVWCGRYDIDTADIEETAEGITVRLGGFDMLSRCDLADIAGKVDIPYGGRFADAAKLLISDVMPWMVYQEDPSSETVARIILNEKSNRLESVRFIVACIGMEALMSMDGTTCIFRVPPTTEDPAAWVYSIEDCRVIKVTSGLDRRRVYNGVVAEGENPQSNSDPFRAEVWITDLTDPTHYVYGTPPDTLIGPRPFFVNSPYINSQAVAQQTAETFLRKMQGLLQRVTIEVPVNPAINVGDVIDAAHPVLGVTRRYLVQGYDMNLDSSMMRLICEERRV
jgi:hypothetical protein